MEFEPNTDGEVFAIALQSDLNASGHAEALWPKGTLIEFGCFGYDLLVVDGKPLTVDWPTKYFTRWRALAAFKTWLAFRACGHHAISA
mgnify:CR=1 FL=1